MPEIKHLFISPGHNFFGHHGKPPGDDPMIPVDAVECVAGLGLREDRFFNYKPDYKGQISFFDWAIYEAMLERYPEETFPPSAFRRNVLLKGVDLNNLIGQAFSLDGIQFLGTEECRPCYWMDRAVGEGAETALRGRGGLRARILSNGTLRTGFVQVSIPGGLSLSE
ncbi:MAG: MOSC domain-containing protein [Opitutales bacterium]